MIRTKFRKNSVVAALRLALMVSLLQLPGLAMPMADQSCLMEGYAIGGNTGEASFTKTFSVYAAGVVPTVVSAKVFFQRAGNTDMAIRIELRNPDGELVDSENVDRVSGREESRTLTAAALNTRCNQPWQLIVKGRNGQAPAAEVFGGFEIRFNEPDPIVHTHPTFAVPQGNTVEQNIVDPTSPGELRLTATWDSVSFLIPHPSRYVLTFVLLRNGQPVRTATGYAHNAWVNNSLKMTLGYQVSATDLQGNDQWTIRVHGSRNGNVENVRITTRLVPRCQC